MTSGAALIATPALAAGEMQVGNAKINVGVGTARITLPDIKFTQQSTSDTLSTIFKHENEDIAWKFGWALEGGAEVPVADMFGTIDSIRVGGFFADIEDTTTLNCGLNSPAANPSVCSVTNIVDDPTSTNKFSLVNALPLPFAVPQSGASLRTEREVDYWGLSIEGKAEAPDPLAIASNTFVSIGAEYRTLEQDIRIRGQNALGSNPTGAVAFNYTEDLDTDYWGAYLSAGADYEIPFIGGYTSGLGLKSSINGRVGIYYVDADYTGRYSSEGSLFAGPAGFVPFADSGNLSLSTDDVAVIAAITLETQLPITRRAAVSVRSIYEFNSWVPDMKYNDTDVDGGIVRAGQNIGTKIDEDDAYSATTGVNLTILLGPDEIMPAQPYK